MKRLLILIILPLTLTAGMNDIKKELTLRNKVTLIMADQCALTKKELYYYKGRSEAFFEVIEMIEQMEMENGSEKERS